ERTPLGNRGTGSRRADRASTVGRDGRSAPSRRGQQRRCISLLRFGPRLWGRVSFSRGGGLMLAEEADRRVDQPARRVLHFFPFLEQRPDLRVPVGGFAHLALPGVGQGQDEPILGDSPTPDLSPLLDRPDRRVRVVVAIFRKSKDLPVTRFLRVQLNGT